MDHTAKEMDRQAARAFGERLRARAQEIGLSQIEVGRLAGIKKQSMTGYWNGDRVCGSDRLFALSDALRANARWLVSGEGPKVGGDLVDVESSDWVMLPRYDLKTLTEAGKGDAVEAVPYRRDWLNHRLLTSAGLWITELPSDYEALGLEEGDAIICSDIDANGPAEKWVCIFKGSAGPFVARYSNRGLAGEMDSPDAMFVTAVDLHGKEVFAVARIRARMLAKL